MIELNTRNPLISQIISRIGAKKTCRFLNQIKNSMILSGFPEKTPAIFKQFVKLLRKEHLLFQWEINKLLPILKENEANSLKLEFFHIDSLENIHTKSENFNNSLEYHLKTNTKHEFDLYEEDFSFNKKINGNLLIKSNFLNKEPLTDRSNNSNINLLRKNSVISFLKSNNESKYSPFSLENSSCLSQNYDNFIDNERKFLRNSMIATFTTNQNNNNDCEDFINPYFLQKRSSW